jgi:hypothetical protein
MSKKGLEENIDLKRKTVNLIKLLEIEHVTVHRDILIREIEGWLESYPDEHVIITIKAKPKSK